MRRRFVFSLAELCYAIAFLAACTAAGVRMLVDREAEDARSRAIARGGVEYALDLIERDLLADDPDIILPP